MLDGVDYGLPRIGNIRIFMHGVPVWQGYSRPSAIDDNFEKGNEWIRQGVPRDNGLWRLGVFPR
jgi:hypothetical protein